MSIKQWVAAGWLVAVWIAVMLISPFEAKVVFGATTVFVLSLLAFLVLVEAID